MAVRALVWNNTRSTAIADLIAYRRRKERLVRVETEAPFTSKYGGQWQLRVYLDNISGTEHVAMVKGNVTGTQPVMVRMHQVNVLTDLFGDASSPKTGELHKAMDQIAAYGCGVVVVLRDQPNTRLSERIKAQVNGEDGPARLMDYGVGAQVLVDLGVPMGLVLASIHERRDRFRTLFQEARPDGDGGRSPRALRSTLRR